jgi:hypothetical protein
MIKAAPAGNEWLKLHFGLVNYSFTHSSYIGTQESLELTSKGSVEQVYGPKYRPADTVAAHLEFALKYDDLSLDFFKAVFMRMKTEELTDFIDGNPNGINQRRLGFLYEFLTGIQLDSQLPAGRKYTDLLQDTKYVTGRSTRNTRWLINNNLLGDASFCPIVRKTAELQRLSQVNIREEIEQMTREFPSDIFRRAANYLYKKETRSSFEIEKEVPEPDRMDRFIDLLTRAGKRPTAEMLNRETLISLQNIIVDPRFAAADYRDFQNYVGEMLANSRAFLHYICPPPPMHLSMMEGLQTTASRTEGIVQAGIRAAVIAFAFVFNHPFEDGNGRLHRFLIHDILVRDGAVPEGLVVPVSANMLNNIADYDRILENYSKPLMQRIKYNMDEGGEVTVLNAEEVEGYYRYPDLTSHAVYLLSVIHDTIHKDIPEELLFLQRYDEAKKALQNIVDMPDRMLNEMMMFLHQNNGILSKRKRDRFEKLTDDEIAKMELAYKNVYEMK